MTFSLFSSDVPGGIRGRSKETRCAGGHWNPGPSPGVSKRGENQISQTQPLKATNTDVLGLSREEPAQSSWPYRTEDTSEPTEPRGLTDCPDTSAVKVTRDPQARALVSSVFSHC